MKTAYVCGPLTELSPETAQEAKSFYERIGDVCQEITGIRAFVPHEHYDPLKHPDFTPQQVDEAERDQVCNKTSVLIVAPIAPSWGGGIEVEMARQSGVPVVIICEKGRKISRLLKGNPAVKKNNRIPKPIRSAFGIKRINRRIQRSPL
ncbi:MAG: hypothetical protein HY005_00355 [Candidatus Staskawiczbacteria bacterium]|nr:hypothetical protein [Candidatus Staskawiczbacteria bacterium]MBI3337062.1 hypothetical protein [Candidatus Staskawiczbacteria bacterium]